MAGPLLSPPRFFAYGTLRRNAPMHSLLEADVRYLGPASYRGRLLDLGDFPGVVASESARDVVVGELFLVRAEAVDEVLARLDRYEGPAFVRQEVQVRGEDEKDVLAWVYHYIGDPARGRQVDSGDWLEDASRRLS